MDKKKASLFFGFGAIFTLLLGTLGHFFYEWSGENPVVGIFFPVNESTWEHIKLVIFPSLVYFAIASVKLIKTDNFFLSAFVATALSSMLIPALFYAYTSFLGYSIIAVDIAIFFISVIVGYTFAKIVYNSAPKPLLNILGLVGLVIIAICFFTFTLYPPQNMLFIDPEA